MWDHQLGHRQWEVVTQLDISRVQSLISEHKLPKYEGKYLNGYTTKTGGRLFATLEQAVKACLADVTAGGIVKSPGLSMPWSVRTGSELCDSAFQEVTMS